MGDEPSYESLRDRLGAFDQAHLLRFWDELDADQRNRLVDQLADLDLPLMDELIRGGTTEEDYSAVAAAASSPPGVRADGSGVQWSTEQAEQRGRDALSQGEVGVVIVAGGQGTRLGFDRPKGMFPIGPVSGRTLFEVFADRLIATNERYGVRVPLYVMTSEATDRETRDYFASHNCLGLAPDDVKIFRQGTMPAVDARTGRLLLSAKDSLALSPDGHGGTLAALRNSGALEDALRRGVNHLAYIQVDNPLVNLCDPTLLGHHLCSGSEMTTQVIRKRYPLEKVGNVVFADGKVRIIEYSDLPDEAAEAVDERGGLRLWAGNIAVHVFDVGFLDRTSRQADALPFHRAHKKVPFIDDDGNLQAPSEPNAIKYERFIFDLLPASDNAIVVEADPAVAFAPVKSADGAPADTPAQAKAAMSALHRRWLEAAGAVVDEGIQVEINPRFADSIEDLAGKISPNLRIDSDRYFGA